MSTSQSAAPRDSFMLHLFRVFRIKYDRLKDLRNSNHLDDVLELSAILRHFLLDGNRLSDDVANAFGLQCSFPLTDLYTVVGEQVFRNDFTPPNNARTFHNRGEFLALDCIRIDNHLLKVGELIDLVANCAGGVHHDGTDPRSRQLAELLLETDHAILCLEVLQRIASSVVEGLSEVRKSVESEFSFLEQRKRKKQPVTLITRTAPPTMYFSDDASLEGYSLVRLDRGGCFLFSFIPPSADDCVGVLLEMGSRRTQQKISVRFADAQNAAIRLHRGRDDYDECLLLYRPMNGNMLFVNWQPVEDNTVHFECALRHTQEERGGFQATNCWAAAEGKVIMGQDLHSRNGARFQSTGCFVLWTNYYSLNDFQNMCRTKPLPELLKLRWIEDREVRSRASVVRVYNQA